MLILILFSWFVSLRAAPVPVCFYLTWRKCITCSGPEPHSYYGPTSAPGMCYGNTTDLSKRPSSLFGGMYSPCYNYTWDPANNDCPVPSLLFPDSTTLSLPCTLGNRAGFGVSARDQVCVGQECGAFGIVGSFQVKKSSDNYVYKLVWVRSSATGQCSPDVVDAQEYEQTMYRDSNSVCPLPTVSQNGLSDVTLLVNIGSCFESDVTPYSCSDVGNWTIHSNYEQAFPHDFLGYLLLGRIVDGQACFSHVFLDDESPSCSVAVCKPLPLAPTIIQFRVMDYSQIFRSNTIYSYNISMPQTQTSGCISRAFISAYVISFILALIE